MTIFFKQDIPKGAAAMVVALALVASVVAGREDTGSLVEPVLKDDARAAPSLRDTSAVAAAIDLDLEKLVRPARQGTVNDLFGRSSVAAPPPLQLSAPPPRPIAALESPTTPPTPPKPTAPALPFQYIGHLIDGGRAVVFLMRGNEPVSFAVGESSDNNYRLEQLSEASAVFTYLPLGERQTLSIPQAR